MSVRDTLPLPYAADPRRGLARLRGWEIGLSLLVVVPCASGAVAVAAAYTR
ncbi:MAG: hypothetical protein ACT4PP_09290 [Sporichthyaceae bacterium]